MHLYHVFFLRNQSIYIVPARHVCVRHIQSRKSCSELSRILPRYCAPVTGFDKDAALVLRGLWGGNDEGGDNIHIVEAWYELRNKSPLIKRLNTWLKD